MPKRKKAELTPKEDAELAKLEEEANKMAKAEGETKTAEVAEEEITSAPEPAPGETETPESVKETKPEPLEEGEEEFTDEELAHFKPKAQKRIRKLAQRAARTEELEKEIAKLRKQAGLDRVTRPSLFPPSEPTVGRPPVSGALPWETPIGEPREVTQEEYDQEIENKAQRLVRGEGDRILRLIQVREDIKEVERKHPELDANREEYDSELATSVVDWFKGLSQVSPGLRLVSFVDRVMGLRRKGAEREKSKVSAVVAKQAAEQAVAPTGAPKKAEGIEELIQAAGSMEELEEAEKLLPHGER